MSSTSSSRGSVWRRWDPHVHLPGTLFNDQFGNLGIPEALDILASRTPSIEAIGITDYFTTASYRRAAEAAAEGAGEGITLIFPNVEMRFATATRKEVAVNVHLLCAPEDVEGLERFLARLTFPFRDQVFRCDDMDLRRLGRLESGESTLPDDAALRAGATLFKIDFSQLKEAFDNDAWARDHILVAVPGSNNDGTAGLQSHDGAFKALRQSIERFAHIIFSGHPKQREFWSGQGVLSEREIVERYKGKKLCIHGSDAHDPDRLGMPADDRRCWLKGAPSFETLKMACLAPETRSHIGPTDPLDGYQHGRIANVSVTGNSWFRESGLAINPGLVAVIGARGSGKTALADLIAVGAGSDEPFNNPASFIRRAGGLLHGLTSELHWTDGQRTSSTISPQRTADPFQLRGVRYLSQQFVEQLCAADGVSDELLNEIERVVFASLPPGDRQGASDFRELLAIRLQAAKSRQEDELDTIAEFSDRISSEAILHRSVQAKENELGRLRREVEELEKQVTTLTKQADPTRSQRLQLVTEVLEARDRQLQAVIRRRTNLEALRSAATSASSRVFPRLLQRLKTDHPDSGLTDEQWAAFRPRFSGDVDRILSSQLGEVQARQAAIAGPSGLHQSKVNLDDLDVEGLRGQTVVVLEAERARLGKLVGLDATRAADLQKVHLRVAEARAQIERLEGALQHAAGAPERRAALQAERSAHYAAYFDALIEEENQLRELYAPLADKLAGFGTSAAKLQLSVKRKVDVHRWAEDGEDLLDLRTTGTFRGTGEMERHAAEELLEAWAAGDGAQAAQAIVEFSAKHTPDFQAQRKIPREGDSEAAYQQWHRDFSRWLYGLGHISISYTLNYGPLSIERLSPGSRGIVLLLLYLAVDRSELDPLIIDQPEENLDPESVYQELVSLFREASRRRQIIMVTHNANLVVNTDVDQVIVAHCESFAENQLPPIQYLTGGLEDPEVRQAVCDVLEGGADAFRERARRLRIPVEGP